MAEEPVEISQGAKGDQSPPAVPGMEPKKKAKALIISASVVVAVLVIGAAALAAWKWQESVEPIPTPTTVPVPTSGGAAGEVLGTFAEYKEVPVNISPQVKSYKVKEDLSNITNKDDFAFSGDAKHILTNNAFVVRSSFYDEFYPLYEENRYAMVPNFVTTDSILHNYHLVFDHILKKTEEEKLAGELKSLNQSMLKISQEQYQELKGTEWESAAKRNVGFFAVGSKTLDVNINVPAIVQSEVGDELKLIEAHAGISASPVMNMGSGSDVIVDSPQGPLPLAGLKEDYSQYVPRGHYDKSELLKSYFKSMMWYGRLTFRFSSEDEIRSATLITLALGEKANQTSWNKIYEPTNFFVGKSDDISFYEFNDIVKKVYGEGASLAAVSGDEVKFTQLVEEAKKLDPPQINSMPVFQASIQSDREEEIKGFRFMGQRFTIDASIFQRLITREVGPKGEPCSSAPFSDGRMLPKGLDIPAAMGSDQALEILKELGELDYACYSENMEKMREHVAGLDTGTWVQNLYWGWMYSLKPLTEETGKGYPSFMQNEAWTKKELNAYLGSWTELKHDTILYAKQVYAELGGSGQPDEKDDRGYIEPKPYVYARLASLLSMTNEGLESRGLLSTENKEILSRMEELAIKLKTISEKELNGESLTEEDYEVIRSYGGQLEHFWTEIHREDMEKAELPADTYMHQNPAAIVADVATDPNGQVLEEGTGSIFDLYVVVPVEGSLRIARGGIYSYYEFPWPMSDRLTDEKWRELLRSEEAPPLPDWTLSFITE